jgi:hypothetical protein
MEIQIHCPHHHKTESLELPESYRESFEGEVTCSPRRGEGETACPIWIKISGGSPVSVRRG